MEFKLKKYVIRQSYITAFLCINQMTVGYMVAWTAPITPILQDINSTPLSYVITVMEVSWINSITYIGVTVGCLLTGWVSNKYGRRKSMFLGVIINAFGYILMAWAYTLSMLLAGRTFVGLASGIISVTNIVYLGEISSPNIRGVLMTCVGIAQSFGSLLICGVGPYVSYRVTSYIMLMVCAVFLAGWSYIPESPLFYIIRDNEENAKLVLRDLGRDNDIEKELENIIQNIKEDKEKKWVEIFTDKFNRKAMFVTVNLFVIQQWSGMLAITFYATIIFDAAGSSVKPAIATIIVSTASLFGTIVVPTFVEKAGRRTLLIVSTAGCCFSMIILGLYFCLDENNKGLMDSVRWLPLLVLIFMSIIYSTGLNVIPNTLLGEMFRPNVRSAGSSTAMTAGFVAGFLFSLSYGYMVDYVGIYVIFWIYAAIDLYGLIFSVLLVPETKGLSLLEIESMMTKGSFI